MKLIHLSDLHMGKRVNEFPMLEDQNYILKEILDIVDQEVPDGVLIAGDVYDKPVPPAEAVQVFDRFLTSLADRELPVFVISGNHDSPERLAFGARLMAGRGVHISPVFDGHVKPVSLTDRYGTVFVYLLPFVKPAAVRPYFPDQVIETFDDAVRCALENITGDGFNRQARNILVAHQFVMGASACDSEELSIGGLEQVNAELFRDFDYVALGHIHGPQMVGRETVRYCGTPLKYSFSEAKHKKSVTVAELLEKGNVSVTTRPLHPLHDLREIKGSYSQVTDKHFYQETGVQDYLHITLTDEEDILDAAGKLRAIYPNIMKLDYDNQRTRAGQSVDTGGEVKRSPLELFGELYELQNNQPMSDEQEKFSKNLMKEIWEELQ